MPYFQVRLSGEGIRLPLDEGDPMIGFFTTRVVKADDLRHAGQLAQENVMSEWREGGQYANHNEGSAPKLVVEASFPIGLLRGIFGRKPAGYSFYRYDD